MSNQTSNVAQDEVVMVQTNIRLREDLKRRAEHLAVDLKVSLASIVNEGLELRVAQLEGK